MARPQNPYAGTYSPSKVSLTKEQLVAGLKGLKIRQPNKKYSGNSYKAALPKEHTEAQ